MWFKLIRNSELHWNPVAREMVYISFYVRTLNSPGNVFEIGIISLRQDSRNLYSFLPCLPIYAHLSRSLHYLSWWFPHAFLVTVEAGLISRYLLILSLSLCIFLFYGFFWLIFHSFGNRFILSPWYAQQKFSFLNKLWFLHSCGDMKQVRGALWFSSL